ncbi:hypothetical protein Lesp02_12770 [Lentzea sp. NBRC 105346]|nr:hypothetical protein Lesp02_12770 [Lentzea sp. NBRC 105346]
MIRGLLVALLFAGGMLAPTSSASAATCYDGAIKLHYDYQSGARDYGPYTTSSRCRDINMRLITDIPGVYLAACVVFVDHTSLCNHDNSYRIFGPPWGTVATDVRDGTHFKLRVRAYDTDAQHVDFKIAY